MNVSRDESDQSEAAAARHELRARLNHIVGYGEILRADAEEAGRADLASLFEALGETALALRPPLARLVSDVEPSPAERESLEREAYGILYELIGMAQDAKGRAGTGAAFAAELGHILESANAILEILADSSASSDRPPPGEGPRGPAALGDKGRDPLERLGLDELPTAPKPGRILVVDADPINRELLSRHLSRQGHEVCAVEGGNAALELLAAEAFDVMLLDVMMPGMNGYQLLERMRDEDRLRDTAVIVISALSDTRSVARCIQLGAEDYLPREFEPVVLKARIESCLEKQRISRERELYVEALVEAQERLRAELHGGAAYMRSLLPPRLSLPSFAADWMFIPSASLGGDAFGYREIAGGKYAIYLLDVSGHGIEAALYSATLLNLLKSQVLPGADFSDPASVFARLNESFRMEEQNNLYFTAWYGVYDPATRELRYSSAGSPPAVLTGPDGSASELATGGTIVGLGPDSAYENGSIAVAPGSRLFLFSDGIYEFRSRSGGIYGLAPFIALVAARAASTRAEASSLDGLLRDVQALSASKRFSDDVSLVEIKL